MEDRKASGGEGSIRESEAQSIRKSMLRKADL